MPSTFVAAFIIVLALGGGGGGGVLLGCSTPHYHASGPVTIFYERGQAAQDVRLRRAVLEARRFLYELSGELPALHPLDDCNRSANWPSGGGGGVLVSVADRLDALHPALSAAGVPTPAIPGSHFVQHHAQHGLLVVSGLDSIATLHGVYTMLEGLGIRFRVGGDVIPRGQRGHGGLAALLSTEPLRRRFAMRREWQSPNMKLRGSQPFFDFPAGPDWWGVQEYKVFMEQASRQKMNFLGLHTYHNEPTVWQDSANISHFDPVSGNITKVDTFPGTQYTYTTTLGGWGSSDHGAGWSGDAMNTSKYLFGADQMYHHDCYGTPAVMGDASICPNPTSEAAQATIFNNVAAMLKDAFTYARNHLGIKTAVGTEAPRNSWYAATMSGDADQSATYEAVFKRVQAAYPIDLWWSWTPEGYIWQEGSNSPVGAMNGAPVVASSCPFDKDTSRYGGVAGQWQNSWLMVNASGTVTTGSGKHTGPTSLSLTLAHPSPLKPGKWCLQPCASNATCKAGDFPAAAPCSSVSSPQQHWHYDSASAQLRSAQDPSLCMEAAACVHDASGGTYWCQAPTVTMQPCRSGYEGQQWDWFRAKPTATAEPVVSAAEFTMRTKHAGYLNRKSRSTPLRDHLTQAWARSKRLDGLPIVESKGNDEFDDIGVGYCVDKDHRRPASWLCDSGTAGECSFSLASCQKLCQADAQCTGMMIQSMAIYGRPDTCNLVTPNKPSTPQGGWSLQNAGNGFAISAHDSETRDHCWRKSKAPPPTPGPPAPTPPVPAGTAITLGECGSSAKPPPTQWTTATASMFHTPISRIAVGGTAIGQACLNCPNVGSDCHVWSCEIDLSKVGPKDCDRNGLFYLSAQGDGTVQIQTYPDTTLCPVGVGQAGPGYCVTAETRRQSSHLTLQKCDLSLRYQQNFQLVDNATSLLQLPSDNAAQPPLPALCVEIGQGPGPGPGPPSPPGPPQPDSGSVGMLRVRGPIPWGNNGCLAIAPTPPCNNSWGQDGYHQKQCAMNDFHSMISAHSRLQPNNFSLAVSGWTLGPGPESNPRGTGGWLNNQLPSNVSIGSMNVECGHAPPDPGFAELPDHATFTIPWMEDDGGQNEPQFWVNRTLEWARQATAYNSSGGLLAEHWRTRAISLQFSALAQYPWQPNLTSHAFYTDFCKSDFGLNNEADAAACAALWDDGKLDPTCERLTTPACVNPSRPPMNGLPAAIKADTSSWASQRGKYSFVDAMWSALDGKITGDENRERWMYWMSQLRSLQADAQFATQWGAMNTMLSKIQAESDPTKRQALVLQQALPLRVQMVHQAELAMLWKINATSTTGGLGAVANFQQMVLTNSLAIGSCSEHGAAQNGCHNYTQILLANSGMATLPAAAMPVRSFRGVQRCFVLSPRGSLENGEALTIRFIALLHEANVGKATATIHYRPMGATGKAFKLLSMGEPERGSVWSATLGELSGDVEYFVSVGGAGSSLVWPAGAPIAPHTVIVV